MVEYNSTLDTIFLSLSDPTRRDMLRRLRPKDQSVGELADHYELTFAAVSKHIQVLEQAKLVHKQKVGRQQLVGLSPSGLCRADDYLKQYRDMWEKKVDRLENYLKNNK